MALHTISEAEAKRLVDEMRTLLDDSAIGAPDRESQRAIEAKARELRFGTPGFGNVHYVLGSFLHHLPVLYSERKRARAGGADRVYQMALQDLARVDMALGPYYATPSASEDR